MEISNVAGRVSTQTPEHKSVRESGADQKAQKMLDDSSRISQQREDAAQKAARESATRQQLTELAAEMNEMATPLHTRISFGYSEDASSMYLNVIDNDSGKVIRQFPSEEALEFAAKMREFVGMLLDKRI
jgi:flagellar protein FlaG